MAGAFDHHLHVMLPSDLGQLAQRLQLAQLGRIIGIPYRAGAQAIAERERHIIGFHDLANVFEMGIEEALLVMRQAPFGHDRAAPRNNTGHAFSRQWHIFQQHAGMDGEIIDPLLGLLNQRVAEHIPCQFFGFAVDFLKRLVNRHGANRHRGIA